MKTVRFFRLLLLLVSFSLLMPDMFAAGEKRFTVVIDAGHGGKDPGAIGKNAKEKDINLKMAMNLGLLIAKNIPDVNIVYTRTSDIFLPLQERANIANRNQADLFISFHANSTANTRVNGFETFVLGTDKLDDNLEVAMFENKVITLEENYKVTYQGFDPEKVESYIMFELIQDEYMDKSIRFASQVQRQVITDLQRNDRGVRQAAFLVLLKAACPAVLIETGFISNADDEKYLTSVGSEQITQSIFKAFQNYYTTYKRMAVSSENNKPTKPTPTASTPKKPVTTPQTPQTTQNETITYFSVQIFATSNPIPEGDPAFKGLTGYTCSLRDGLYKYIYGQYLTYEEAKKMSLSMKDRFPDCFVVKLNK